MSFTKCPQSLPIYRGGGGRGTGRMALVLNWQGGGVNRGDEVNGGGGEVNGGGCKTWGGGGKNKWGVRVNGGGWVLVKLN